MKIKYMIILQAALLLAAESQAFGLTITGQRAEDKIMVQKNGDLVFIRSYFSPTQDVVVMLNRGTNRQINYYQTAIIPAYAPPDKTEYDFNAVQDFTVPILSPLRFKAIHENIDPLNPPNRFIQFLGHTEQGETVRDVGYAFGIVNDFELGLSSSVTGNSGYLVLDLTPKKG